jgi:predicted RNase H-like nuclease (RuvC/YqgF family)
MTRGKHGISAAARQAVGEREKQIEAYQHNIRKLTAENAELKQKLADQQASHSKTVRILKVERDEGLSPQLTVIQKENERLKERLAAAEAASAHWRDWFAKIFDRLGDHVKATQRLTQLETIEVVHAILGEAPGWSPPENKHAAKLGPEAVKALERAHGWRR